MPKTRRSKEPFYEPSVDASTEAERRHSVNVVLVYRNRRYTSYRLYIHCVYTNVPLYICMMSTSVSVM